jgi:hypothetical protein
MMKHDDKFVLATLPSLQALLEKPWQSHRR